MNEDWKIKNYRIHKDLEFNELEIEDEIGEFEIVEECETAVLIESEFGIKYKVEINKITNHLQLVEEGYESDWELW